MGIYWDISIVSSSSSGFSVQPEKEMSISSSMTHCTGKNEWKHCFEQVGYTKCMADAIFIQLSQEKHEINTAVVILSRIRKLRIKFYSFL